MCDDRFSREVRLFKWMLFVIAAIIVSPLFFMSSASGPSASRSDEPKKPTEAECRADLQCWGRKFEIDAKYACKPKIERLASWDVKWDDGFLTPTFTRIGWLDEKAGTLKYAGDKVRFQNGFGAFRKMTYACSYDPEKKAVLDVRLFNGTLDD